VSEAAAHGRGCGGGTRGGAGRDGAERGSEMDFGGNGGVFGRAEWQREGGRFSCTDEPEVEVISRAGASSVRGKRAAFSKFWMF
jgi:hypothetical protein